MSSIPVPLKTRRVGERCTLNLPRAEMFSRCCGVVVRRRHSSSGVVHVIWPWFKGRGPSPKALVQLNSATDEAHFWLNGYVNKQNCRIWSEANPQVYVETPLHPEKLTVWCALWTCGIIGPYFFKNDEGHNVTVKGDRYRAMITNFFIPELNNHDVQELRFQQDGATSHTARATIDLLKDTFGDRLISRLVSVNWPQDLVI
ncbi:putative DD41D transposase [Trichonephila clavipes]|nr:putative DD41D transposase [Trichonephila clavipes]